MYFVILFKCDLNPAVSIITASKMSCGHRHPFQFHFTQTPLKNVTNTIYFVMSFRHDLSQAVNIITVWKVRCDHGYPFQFHST